MDDAFDKELKDQLSRDPFPRRGFDARLRRRILERIDGKPERSGRFRGSSRMVPAYALSAFVVLLFGMGLWVWNGQHQGGTQEAKIQAPASAPLAETTAAPALPTTRYALLIGLREDTGSGATGTVSRYRTVLIAPQGSDPDRLELAADVAGLYMPYGQNFWEIAVNETADGRQALQAIQATGRKSVRADTALTGASIPDYLLNERVVYAGNRYLSIRSEVRDARGGIADNLWVKDIAQLGAARNDPAAEPHVALEELVPNAGNADPSGKRHEQWGISRIPGQWAAQTPGGDLLGVELPTEAVQHDQLTLSWEQIQRLEPGSLDAFTYGNMLGVVTNVGGIRVRTVRDGESVSDPVTVPLAKGETVVMIQWAQDPYVDRWIEAMRSFGGQQP
ncbi:hypothetical protein [Cohnella caldifontis]|uniref:hypothetical protein n=1 Tax=Cohnella caldifontis TaxID=3027471 RepID=UPI0023EC3FD2|nr:hypothetical protein [Cohnella sp. YIM B05605]